MSRAEVLQELADLRERMDGEIALVASGSCSISDVFARRQEFPHVAYLYAVKILEADARIGKVQARRMIDEVGGGETTKIGDLSEAQIDLLLGRITA